jgi:hypothetical protein
VLPWTVVDGTNMLVVSGAVVVIVTMVGLVVSGDAVVASWKVVVPTSAVVVILLHWHNRAGQKGVAWLQLLVHHSSVASVVKARHLPAPEVVVTSTVVVTWTVVDGMLVVANAVVKTVVLVGIVVSRDAVVVRAMVVVLASAMVVVTSWIVVVTVGEVAVVVVIVSWAVVDCTNVLVVVDAIVNVVVVSVVVVATVVVVTVVVVVSLPDDQESLEFETSARVRQSTSIHSNGIRSPRSHGRGFPPSTGIKTSAPRWSITMSASGLTWLPRLCSCFPTLSTLMAMTTLNWPSWRSVRSATQPPQRDLSTVVKSWP